MTKRWFWIGMTSVFFLSLALRFWGLGRFNTLVFDEIYYATYGNDYLSHTPYFDAHPPLGKYIIAIGIWVGKRIFWWQDSVNGLTGAVLSPWSYRWINAFFGSFIPLIVAGIAYQLNHRRSFAFLAGLFTACDGIFLVESRYALINQYIVIFGLLGHWLLLLALSNQNRLRSLWLILSGISFGASISTKWNGLFFLAGVYLIWFIAWFGRRFLVRDNAVDDLIVTYVNYDTNIHKSSVHSEGKTKVLPWENFTQLNIWQLLFNLGVIPFAVYRLLWIPHLQLDTKYGFIQVHQKMLEFHETLGRHVHPYCASWYKWPLMIRPMAYYYQTAQSIKDPLPVLGPPLPAADSKVVYDVHAMGNPFLWWAGFAALLYLAGMLAFGLIIPWIAQKRLIMPKKLSTNTWVALYLVLNYAVNLFPWVGVNRCLFIYLYMTGVVFAFLAIAYVVDFCLHSYLAQLRVFGLTITFLILVAFVFWIPIYLGLPLSEEGYSWRMWFRSWI